MITVKVNNLEAEMKRKGISRNDIAQGFARGDSYEKLVRNLRQRFGKVSADARLRSR